MLATYLKDEQTILPAEIIDINKWRGKGLQHQAEKFA